MQASCAFVLEKSAAFFDNALSEAETILISEHLEICLDCAQIYTEMDRLDIQPPRMCRDSIDILEDPEYWDEMDESLSSALDEQSSSGGRYKRWDRRHLLLVAITLFCVGWGFYQQSRVVALSIVVESQQKELKRLHDIYMQVPVDVPNPYIVPSKPEQARYDL
jgi:predicted anti-sigma-YlaC factor YlaD